MLNAVGDGLAGQSWGDAELEKIAADLAAIRLWEDYRRAFASERGFGNSMTDQVLSSWTWNRATTVSQWFNASSGLTGGPTLPPTSGGLIALIPRALYRNNQLRMNQYHDDLQLRAGSRAAELDPDEVTTTGPERLEGYDACYFFLFRFSAPIFSSVVTRFVTLETKLRQARIAVALERFRLGRGAFPETLDELAPAFLSEVPGDLHAAAPMRYARRERNTFLLYAIGRDRTDHGGAIEPKKSEKQQADLIWLYAP